MTGSLQEAENGLSTALAPSSSGGQVANRERLSTWEGLHSRQDVLFKDLIEENSALIKRVEELERDLRVWRMGFEHNERENQELTTKVHHLEGSLISVQNDNPLIACLIDGDGAIFSEDLLIRGQEGGRQAAALLTRTIKSYLNHESSPHHPVHSYQIYAAIYYNGPGLAGILVQNKVCDAKDFADFVEGFNQATPLFTFVDVGWGKEAADAKLRESLRLFIKFPQTKYLFFGGAHDNGYLHTLRSIQTEGLLQKIIVLKGNAKIARDVETYIDEMSISVAECPDLFLRLKLKPRSGPMTAGTESSSTGRASPNKAQRTFPKKQITNAASYSVDNMVSDSVTDNPSADTPGPQKVFRSIDPTKPLSKQKPPPCNNYYLATCFRPKCTFAHDYDLSPEQIDGFRQTVKKTVPCPEVNANKPCFAGNTCIFAHICNFGPNCWHFKQGKCRFKGEYAHLVVEGVTEVTEF